jgi:acyl-CoA thioester hydrolase
MEVFEHKIRVRYGETDQMGFVYYGNYALYFEETRTELIRSLGLTYASLEKSGVMMPVVNMNITYRKPAKYDDRLILECWIAGEISRKITFRTLVKSEHGDLLNESEITLVFIDVKTGKSIQCPKEIVQKLEKFVHV